MKDYYDLYHLLSKEKYNSEILQEAIVHTFKNRHTSYDADTMFFRDHFANNQQMKIRWQAFLRKITKKEKMAFSDVVTYIQDALRPYWKMLAEHNSTYFAAAKQLTPWQMQNTSNMG